MAEQPAEQQLGFSCTCKNVVGKLKCSAINKKDGHQKKDDKRSIAGFEKPMKQTFAIVKTKTKFVDQ